MHEKSESQLKISEFSHHCTWRFCFCYSPPVILTLGDQLVAKLKFVNLKLNIKYSENKHKII